MHRCSCGFIHNHHQPNSFSMFFAMPAYDQNVCPYAASSSSSSSVDCTLSLATPSTRLSLTSEELDSTESSQSSSRFCWDFLQSDNHSSAPASHKTNRGGGVTTTVDSLLARRCANCDTTSTPLWRNGPRGPKSLCNACGIRFKKEERRANAAATTVVSGGGGGTEGYNGNTWMQMQHTQAAAAAATHKLPASCYSPAGVGNEFRFVDDVDDRDSTFLSWRLNVTDRAGLVHDFTRY